MNHRSTIGPSFTTNVAIPRRPLIARSPSASRRPRKWSRSNVPGCRSTARVARAAAQETGFPLKVPVYIANRPRATAAGVTLSKSSAAPDDRTDREAAAQRLSKRGQVRHDAVVLLGPAQRQPEPGHHLVEDQGMSHSDVTARTPARKPGFGRTLPRSGSTMTAPSSARCARMIALAAARSL